jgi:ketosteroid isomerase-like protein
MASAIVHTTPVHGTLMREDGSEDAAIRRCLERLNEVTAYRNLDSAMSIWDGGEDISLIGSDSGEVYIGRANVIKFFKMINRFSFTFSFDLDQVRIDHEGGIAWVFVDGKMVHHRSDGRLSKVPYRITAVMVKRGAEWRWKVFSGSIPRGE